MPSTHIPESTAEEQTDNCKPINLDCFEPVIQKMNLDCFESVMEWNARKAKELTEIYVEDRSSPLTCRQKNERILKKAA